MMRGPCHPIHFALAPALWALWFTALYGGLSLGCELSPPPAAAGMWTWLNAALAAFTVAALVPQLWLAGRCWAARRGAPQDGWGPRFAATVSAGLYGVGAAATLFVGAPILALPPCI